MSLLKRGPATSDGRPLTAVERDSAREAAAQALRQELTPKAIIDKTPAAMARAGEFLPQFMRRWLEEVRHQDPTLHLSQQDIDGLATQVYQQIFGLGFLEAYLPPQRTDLSEISILPDGRVTVQRKGAQRFEVTDQKISRAQMDDILQRLLGAMSRSISQAWPIEGTRIPPTANLPTGARVHAVAPPVVVGHMATLNVRLFESKFVTPQTLLDWGSVTPEMDAFLAERISEGCGVLVSGATGSGKTTFLNYLSYYIHQYDRVIT
ncbi:MAG: Flp pilus assembly complex ATPase component TadA, partial [Chloroflexi bacterium]|nr:Flp pilus assembly complex ATPase component TadA [Chloroflexota bacterium]